MGREKQGTFRLLLIGSPDNIGKSQITFIPSSPAAPTQINANKTPWGGPGNTNLPASCPREGALVYFHLSASRQARLSTQVFEFQVQKKFKSEDLPHLPKDSGWEVLWLWQWRSRQEAITPAPAGMGSHGLITSELSSE